jgi:hypothetical protein
VVSTIADDFVMSFTCALFSSDESLEAELSVEQDKITGLLNKADGLRKEMEAKQNQLKQAKKQGQ